MIWHLFFEDYLIEMLGVATSQMAHPLSQIFDDSFEHFNLLVTKNVLLLWTT